ncbi:MAG TPA: GNAT family N-acetyltransferase [Candidatus Saccharimonadales bacterium]|nr:GNAT family N-acetyltransferase [Candidatus Saccharimonadales bacterium]
MQHTLPVIELPSADEDPNAATLLREAAHLVRSEFPAKKIKSLTAHMQSRLTLISIDKGSVVATAGLEIESDCQRAILEDIVVASEYQRRSLGSSMIKMLEAKARETGIATISVTPVRSAVGFYERLGYESGRWGNIIFDKAL